MIEFYSTFSIYFYMFEVHIGSYENVYSENTTITYLS